MKKGLPQTIFIDGYQITQADNYHVTIVRLSDNKRVFHAQCDKVQDAQEMLNFYKMMSNN